LKPYRLLIVWSLLTQTYFRIFRPSLLTWGLGLEAENIDHLYHGDQLIPKAHLIATRAITINASKEQVWQWLVQMGRNRTGFYGIDRLDNWNIPSARYLREDLDPLECGIMLDNGLQVLDFHVNRYLLIGGFYMPNDFAGTTDVSYLYQLEAISPTLTRLTIRMRCHSVGLKGWLYDRVFEVVDSLLTIAQLKGIKERVEDQAPEFMPIPLSEVDVVPTEFEPR
jgi:hypothetical protein